MKQKELLYKTYQRQIKDKDTALNGFMSGVLNMTIKMFEYSNMPETLESVELEKLLQVNGHVGVANVDGNLYALLGVRGGELDAYYRGKEYTVANPYLHLNKTYTIGSDIVVINNNAYAESLLPLVGKYGVLYTDALITLNMTSILDRITMLISASDDKTKQSADVFLQKVLDGDFSIIGENAFFKGVSMQNPPSQSNQLLTQLIELLQYYKASMFNSLGLNANYNMKRERLNTQEVSMNIDALMPSIDAMLDERKRGVDKVNEMFGTDIQVTLGSSWKIEHENYLTLLANTERLQETETPVEETEHEETETPVEETEHEETEPPVEETEHEEENDKDKEK